jgi:hypothetical protein
MPPAVFLSPTDPSSRGTIDDSRRKKLSGKASRLVPPKCAGVWWFAIGDREQAPEEYVTTKSNMQVGARDRASTDWAVTTFDPLIRIAPARKKF